MKPETGSPELRRVLTLPLLVFYGVGVTVGAGIFALIGEIVALAGDAAPLAFLIAGVVAGATGLSYALLVRVYPLAGGEAVFVTRGIGRRLGWLTGIGVAATGIISAAAISLAFAGYAGTLTGLPANALAVAVILALTGIAWWGIRESVALAAIITLVEVGTLLVVIAFGIPRLADLPPAGDLLALSTGAAGRAAVLNAALIAFFAFVGFEDIENMAEETVNPARTAPRAILWTLAVTVVLYIALSLVAVSVPRAGFVGSAAPMAVLFEQVTGLDGRPVSALAAIAMINGILVQIVMSARVLYGMASEGLIPAWFAGVSPLRRTPARATFFVGAFILVLTLALPLVRLAELTSLVVLAVFTLVNLALYALAGPGREPSLRRWRYWGLAAAALCVAILAFQLADALTGF